MGKSRRKKAVNKKLKKKAKVLFPQNIFSEAKKVNFSKGAKDSRNSVTTHSDRI